MSDGSAARMRWESPLSTAYEPLLIVGRRDIWPVRCVMGLL